jgi:hypothetical protein
MNWSNSPTRGIRAIVRPTLLARGIHRLLGIHDSAQRRRLAMLSVVLIVPLLSVATIAQADPASTDGGYVPGVGRGVEGLIKLKEHKGNTTLDSQDSDAVDASTGAAPSDQDADGSPDVQAPGADGGAIGP